VFFLDLDRFKVINEALGHQTGDRLLKAATKRLAACITADDVVARLGGDEFALIQTQVAHVDDATTLAQQLIDAFSRPFLLDGQEIHTSISIGITIYPFDDSDPDHLLKNADMAMYRAKREGRSQYHFYTADMNTQTQTRMTLEKDLRRALTRREFLLNYQPQVDLRSGRIMGMEALLRWQKPGRGMVSPAEFIPVAEDSGLILPIGEWVLREACAQNKIWQDAGLPPLRVTINISARQFGPNGGSVVDTVDQVLRETGLAPAYLELELTESLIMANPEHAAVVLHQLKEMGVGLAIDDFGTGYSSLSYLKRFPIDKLKIDRSFVRDITVDPSDAAIVNAVISLGHSLNLKVIAEGVETADQLAYLQQQACDGIQGYYFSRPLPAISFTQLLRRNKSLHGGAPAAALCRAAEPTGDYR
ncbi:MAG: EAL domain-containing protein, partial [Pseudomonadota bacterium]